MDRDVRSDKPGKCPRCGMTLAFGVQKEIEYPLEITFRPPVFRAGEKVQIHFRMADPVTGKTVNHYEVVHEKLFHMFLVSQDLQYFVHDHPVLQPNGTFDYEEIFPKPGMYRIAGRFLSDRRHTAIGPQNGGRPGRAQSGGVSCIGEAEAGAGREPLHEPGCRVDHGSSPRPS